MKPLERAIRSLLLLLVLLLSPVALHSQDTRPAADTLARPDSTLLQLADSLMRKDSAFVARHMPLPAEAVAVGPRRGSQFTPDPVRALWMGLVVPGGGQIYNRKYWKLPIFYGGFLGCMYALTWNNMMLRDYSQAYLDIMDDDPSTASYQSMLPLGYDITGKEDRFKEIFKNKKDYFRKYRDMSIFAFIGVYALAVIDAYVDAELSTFDISRDLTLNLAPAVLRTGMMGGQNRSSQLAYGVTCSLQF